MKVAVAVIAVVLVACFTLLAGAQGLRVLLQLTGRKRRAEGQWDGVGGALEDDRRRSLHNLAEIQFDYETGKIDTADYDALRARYEARAVAAMRALDARAGGAPEVAAVAAVAADAAAAAEPAPADPAEGA